MASLNIKLDIKKCVNREESAAFQRTHLILEPHSKYSFFAFLYIYYSMHLFDKKLKYMYKQIKQNLQNSFCWTKVDLWNHGASPHMARDDWAGYKAYCSNETEGLVSFTFSILLVMWFHTFQGATTGICVDSTHPLIRKLSAFLLDDLWRDPVSNRTGIK